MEMNGIFNMSVKHSPGWISSRTIIQRLNGSHAVLRDWTESEFTLTSGNMGPEFSESSSPSSVSCHTIPSKLTLVPGWQGPKQAESPSRIPDTPPFCVLVPTDRVLTTSCFGLEVGRAGVEKEGAEGREGPGAPGWPGAGGAGTVNMGSACRREQIY